ncbi:mediator of RNA polymerase II transcription subunit 1-domain-containing protein [Rhizopus microsporus]
MSKQPDLPKNSINSAIVGLQDTLRNLQQQWPCLQKNATTNTKQPNELHALGPVNLDKTRQEFSQHINSIRNICSQFETEVLGDVMKMGAGADPAFRKHFTHLKEQATLESTVTRLKNILIKSKERLEESLKEKDESKSKIEIQRLEKIAQSMGLITFVDSSKMFETENPITTITLGGTLIVIDIDIDDVGRIHNTKVTFVSESMQAEEGDRVDRILKENLQSCNFELFKRNLQSLALLDQLNVMWLSKVEVTNLMNRQVESDLLTVLLEGHGIPCLHLNYPGISICYWVDKFHNDIDWEQVKEQYIQRDKYHPILSQSSKLLISFEDCIQEMHYLPTTRSSYLLEFDETEEDIDSEQFKVVYENNYPKFMSPLRFVKPLSSTPSVQIRFIATLDPPIPVSDGLCQKIMNLSGMINTDSVISDHVVASTTSTSVTSETLSLEEILVPDIAPTKQYIHDKQIYKWMSSSKVSAKIVTRIPFQHPVQLYSIIQCLRQQEMFNILFKSIFSTTQIIKDSMDNTVSFSLKGILAESEKEENLIVEVTTVDAPYSIHITLSPSSASSFIMVPLSIDIPANDPTKPIVRLQSSPIHKWNTNVFKQDLMSKELQSTYNLPAFIRWLSNRMSQDSFIKRERQEDDMSLVFKKAIKYE